MRIGLIILIVCIFSASNAEAVTITGQTYPYQKWAHESKTFIPSIDISVIETNNMPCDHAWACTDSISNIWISTRDKFVFYHELGHIYFQYFPGRKDRIIRTVGWDSWHEELAANGFAYCAIHGNYGMKKMYRFCKIIK